ncbi:MAG TPA: histidine kinase [Candidatus Limnocylindrales bacterium]|nr:histidine kinase [Candidatus Limnocylindrales bacterium]
MDDGRDSPLAHALRLAIVLAGAAGAAVLLSGIDSPFAAPVRAGALVDPERLSTGLVSGLVLVAASVVLLASSTARLLGVAAFLSGISIALATAAGQEFVAPGIAVAAVIVPVSMAVLLVALVIAFDAELGGGSRPRRLLIVSLMIAALGAAALRLIVYNPFMEVACGTACGAGKPMVPIPPAAYLRLTRIGDVLIAATAIVTLVVAGRWLITGRARRLPVALVGLGSSLIAAALLLGTIGVGDAGAPGGLAPAGLQAAASAGRPILAVGVAWWAWDTVRLRVRLEQAAAEIAAATGARPVATALAEALGGGPVSVTYPMPDGAGEVGPDGSAPVQGSSPGWTTTLVLRHDTPIATIHHRDAIDASRVTAQLSPTVLVALDIEHLRAVRLATLGLVRASRARIVAAQDAERRRVERDLHDGAQQRVLAIAMDLRLACSRASREGRADAADSLRTAEGTAFAALDELRRLARGVHPAILSQGGLGPALSSLAEEMPVPMTLAVDRSARLPALVEAIAYQVVAETVADAARLDATEVAVSIHPELGTVTIEVEFDGREPGVPERVLDRIGAAGGSVGVEALGSGRHRVRAVLPCV